MTGLLYCAALLALAVVLLAVLTGGVRLHATLALAGVVVAFGFAADMTISSIGRTFSIGFVHTLIRPGWCCWRHRRRHLRRAIRRGGPRGGRPSPLAPVVRHRRTGRAGRRRRRLADIGTGAAAAAGAYPARPFGAGAVAVAAGLALRFVPPSPIAIAGSSVLGADAMTVLAIGAPLAVVVTLAGWFYAGRALPRVDDRDAPLAIGPMRTRDVLVVVLPVLVPIALLIVQSVAQIPSEPLGRGGMRELFTGISRPLMLMVCAAGLALLVVWRWTPRASERGWAGEAIIAAAGALMVMGTPAVSAAC